MKLDMFIVDFERTENSDELHGIFGRALIVATRFDSMCEAAATMIGIEGVLIKRATCGEVEYEKLVSQIITKHVTLDGNIKKLGLSSDVLDILHSARKSRNCIAHELTRGLYGCLDIKSNYKSLIDEVSKLVGDIACGDVAISMVMSLLNGEQLPTTKFAKEYKDKIIKWVVER